MTHSAGTNGIMSSYQHSIKLPLVMGSSFSEGMKQFKKDIIIEGSSDKVSICLNAMSATAIAYSAGSTCNEVNCFKCTILYTCIHTHTKTNNLKIYIHIHAQIRKLTNYNNILMQYYVHPTCLPSTFFDFRFFGLLSLDITLFFVTEVRIYG